MARIQKKTWYSKLNWKFLTSSALVLVLVVAGLELTNVTHLFHDKKAVSGTIPSTSPTPVSTAKDKSPSKDAVDNTNPGNDNANTSQKSDTATSGPTLALKEPRGTFVSNHQPNLSGSPAPTSEHSVCVTTPGASCFITFSNADIDKTLKSQVAGSDGAVHWYWDVKEAGLTVGSWQIKATATSNGKFVSTIDGLLLEVKP